MSKANSDSLSALHGELAELLRDEIRKMKDGTSEVNASLLSSARQFLKDNHIEATVEASEPLSELTEEYPFEDNIHQFPSR